MSAGAAIVPATSVLVGPHKPPATAPSGSAVGASAARTAKNTAPAAPTTITPMIASAITRTRPRSPVLIAPFRRRGSAGGVREIHLPPEEVRRLIEDLHAVIDVRNVPRAGPAGEERCEPLGGGLLLRGDRPRVRHDEIGCAVEQQGRGFAGLDRGEQLCARERHCGTHR